MEKLPRAYIANVIFTIVGAPFKAWIDGVCDRRNQKLVEEQNLTIDMDPDIYKAFMASHHVSVQNGSSGHLMKVSLIHWCFDHL